VLFPHHSFDLHHGWLLLLLNRQADDYILKDWLDIKMQKDPVHTELIFEKKCMPDEGIASAV
jgi:hypothetical protein